MRSIASVLVPAALLLGCGDAFYSIRSDGTLPANLDVRCIAQTLAGDPDGANGRLNEPVHNLPDGPGAGRPVTYIWSYGEGGHSYLAISRQADGWTYGNGRFYLGDEPEAFGMFRFEPVMKRINAALVARCGLRLTQPGP